MQGHWEGQHSRAMVLWACRMAVQRVQGLEDLMVQMQ